MMMILQAQQQIPDWLEEMSAASVGIGGFTNSAGQAKDTRHGNVRYFLLLLCEPILPNFNRQLNLT